MIPRLASYFPFWISSSQWRSSQGRVRKITRNRRPRILTTRRVCNLFHLGAFLPPAL